MGPRPEMLENVEKYTDALPEFEYRLRVKAGLTGLAQISGNNTSPKDKLVMDLIYIENYKHLAGPEVDFPNLYRVPESVGEHGGFGVEEVFDFDEDREKKRRAAFEEREAAQEEAGHGD